jgi:aspartyl-tRNA(Asn)/glutamyl-tRNA(Gln) amidotransferase subunit C
MPVSLEDVEKVALLARLQFSEEEKKQLVADLNRILDYFEKLKELDTEDVPPTSHVLPLKNVFREDVVVPSMPREKLLANAPDQAMGHFKVPQVIEDS